MQNYAVRVQNIGKEYTIGAYQGSYKSIRESLIRTLMEPIRHLGRKDGRSRADRTIWALKDVSFDIGHGDVVGIIGRNGAGKSTLLKILARITQPTKGELRLRGRVGSLLEVGTGFHPELTGRENIFLNGAILGMSRKEIQRKFDEIVEFSEIEKFIDTPAKHYSSGMYMRLAFAVAAHLEPEILLIDEVLAVGDALFQKKCLGKMGDVAREGRTVLFVSHNMAAIKALCRRVIVLDHGLTLFDGEVEQGIHFYTATTDSNQAMNWTRSDESSSSLCFQEIKTQIVGKQPQLVLECDLTLLGVKQSPPAFVAIDIADRSLTPIMQAIPEPQPFTSGGTGVHKLHVDIELPPLVPGIYSADFWVGPHYSSTLDYIRRAITFEVNSSPVQNRSFPFTSDHGFISPISHVTYQPPGRN